MNKAREAIENIYKDYQQYSNYLLEQEQISFLNDYRNDFTKIFLLCIASLFEKEIIAIIHNMLHTEKYSLLKEFVNNKPLNRQYHTFFQWNENNANTFFSVFGQEYKIFMGNKVKNDDKLKLAIKDFLELGNTRNQLVHENYALFSVPFTVEELYSKYDSAKYFVDNILTYTNEYNSINIEEDCTS